MVARPYVNMPSVKRVEGAVASQALEIYNQERFDKLAIQLNVSPDAATAREAVTGDFQVDVLTFEAVASMDDGEYLVLEDALGGLWAAAAKFVAASVAQVDDLTFEAKADMDDGEYVVIYDSAGNAWAIAADLTGTSAAPLGAIYTAIPAANKAQVDLSLTTDAASVAAAFEAAFNALVGFTDVVTLDDTAADGTMIVTQDVAGACTEPVSKLSDDSNVGGVTVAQTTDGATESAAPTGAIYTAIPAANKAQVDLSSATDAASVAAAFEVALDGLTGFSSVIATDDTAADGTMTLTHAVRGPADEPVSYLEDDSDAGDITSAQTTLGVVTTVDLDADTITISAHGLVTGRKAALSIDGGTLPAGLSATDYFIIVVDADTIQLASSYANAIAGTEVDITDLGTAGQTMSLTPTAAAGDVKVQWSNDLTNWKDYASVSLDFTTTDASDGFLISNAYGRFLRVYLTVDTSGAGQVDVAAYIMPR